MYVEALRREYARERGKNVQLRSFFDVAEPFYEPPPIYSSNLVEHDPTLFAPESASNP